VRNRSTSGRDPPIQIRRIMPIPRLSHALGIALALCISCLAHAQPREAEGAYDGDAPRLHARLRVDPQGGGRWRVGVELAPEEGWHLYGHEPGDVGLPPQIEWQLPGAHFGELAWPPALRFFDASSGIESFGYDRPVLLATSAEVPAGARELAVSVDALVCENMCLPAHFDLAAPLDPAAPAAGDRERFDAAARELAPAANAPSAPPASAISWLTAIALGWLGGLVLNLMPCVLPVLAIKIAALAEIAARSRREQIQHAAAYAAGITASMLALAICVVVLRNAGSSVGWGFQLQEPAFLVGISALLVAFALNLFGAFEILVDTSRIGAIGSGAPGPARSFFDGLLAVALATPCSAPFLGTAVGFAFASPAPVIAAIFLSIGLGLATPFVLAAASPAVARRIPRSGAWMADVRAVLGFALLFTIVWLLWILGRVASPDAIPAALVLLLAIAAASWALGLAQRRGRAISGVMIAAVLGAIAAPGIVTLHLAPGERAERAPAIARARAFSAEAVRASLSAGHPVFVYFTADWCLTCKVNERALADSRIEPELERSGYDVYRADWTRRDEAIGRALAALGKAGVPAYAVYAPGDPDHPRLLPELLTTDSLLTALREGTGAPVANR
jgi:thiol:disulfide interchange protein DsbD